MQFVSSAAAPRGQKEEAEWRGGKAVMSGGGGGGGGY